MDLSRQPAASTRSSPGRAIDNESSALLSYSSWLAREIISNTDVALESVTHWLKGIRQQRAGSEGDLSWRNEERYGSLVSPWESYDLRHGRLRFTLGRGVPLAALVPRLLQPHLRVRSLSISDDLLEFDLQELEALTSLEELSLSGKCIAGSSLAPLSSLRSLTRLTCDAVDSVPSDHVSGISSLHVVYSEGMELIPEITSIQFRGIPTSALNLACLTRLRCLSCTWDTVDHQSWPSFLASVRPDLDLELSIQVSVGVPLGSQLPAFLPRVSSLSLSFEPDTDHIPVSLLSHALSSRLRTLELRDLDSLALGDLAPLDSLESLSLSVRHMTIDQPALLPHLRELSIGCPDLDSRALRGFVECHTSLTYLDVDRFDLSSVVAFPPRLRDVGVTGVSLIGPLISHCSSLRTLQAVILPDDDLSAVASIAERHESLCSVTLLWRSESDQRSLPDSVWAALFRRADRITHFVASHPCTGRREKQGSVWAWVEANWTAKLVRRKLLEGLLLGIAFSRRRSPSAGRLATLPVELIGLILARAFSWADVELGYEQMVTALQRMLAVHS